MSQPELNGFSGPEIGKQSNLLEMLFDRMPMGIAIIDRDFRVQRYNSTWDDFSARYAPLEAAPLKPGVGYFEHLPGSEKMILPLFERVLLGEMIQQNDVLLESGGIVTYWDIVLAPITQNKEITGLLAVSTDATERVLLQQNLEKRVEERTHELMTLIQVARDINAVLSLENLLETVLDQLKTVIDYIGASILTLDGDQLVVRAYRGPIDKDNARKLRFPIETAALNREVLNQRQPLMIDDIHADAPLAQMFRETAGDQLETTFGYVRSWLGVPLIAKGSLLGMLTLDHDQPDIFQARHADLVQTFANQVAVAIENARLYQRERHQYQESERRRQVAESLRDIMSVLNSGRPPKEIFDNITTCSAELMRADACLIYSVQDKILTNESYFNLPDEFEYLKSGEIYLGAANRSLLEGNPVQITDVRDYLDQLLVHADLTEFQRRWYDPIREHYASYIGFPLMVRKQLFGGLVFYYQDRHEFDSEDLELGAMLGEQAALAIENARLQQAEQARQRELQILLDVAETANSSLDMNEVVAKTLDLLVALIGASRAGVIFADVSTGQLGPYILRPPREIDPVDLAPLLQAAQNVHASGETLYIAPDPEAGLLEPGALLPLQTRGQILGILGIIGSEGSTFTPKQLTLFKSIADQLGVAIENASLFEKAEDAAIAAERNRLARDLHDAVTQTLFSASMIADVLPKIWERTPEEGLRRLEELRQLTRGALSEMRTLLVELRPAALVDTDLGDLINHQVNAFIGRTRLPVEFNRTCQQNPPTEVKEMFYRIVQEAFNNIAKHAEATHVSLTLNCLPGQAALTIQDNGVGFDFQSAMSEGLGLGIMQERVHSVGASLEINSRVREGTQLHIFWQDPNNEELNNDG